MSILLVLQIVSCIPVITCFENIECHYEYLSPIFSSCYAFCRFMLLLIFVGRLYFTFNDTVFSIKKWLFISIIVVDLLVITGFIVGSYLFADHLHDTYHTHDESDHDHDHHGHGHDGHEEETQNHGNAAGPIYLTFSYYLIDIIIAVIVLFMFVKRIRTILSNVDKSMTKLETLTQKYIFLMMLAVSSTFILVLILGILQWTVKDEFTRLLFVYICLSIDSIINCNCVYYSMGYTNQTYNKYCKGLEIGCLNCFRLKDNTPTFSTKTSSDNDML